MINLSDRSPAHYPQRARTELSAAWEHLLTATQEAARQVGDTSRARGSLARDRAALARLALRGELPNSRWRWAGIGLAAGVIIGAVAAATLNRRPHPHDSAATAQPDDPPSAVADKARSAAVTVAERASAAARTATAAAQDAAAKAREKLAGREPAAESSPPTVPATDSDD
ncbi:hypothetical protein EDC02_5197 [Micromonospora sp. Llam0]|uniref:hypothetical protein n=1 Tax=Micromonospora sp. Llam0 TaxID=2485143 RepID=UPI000F4706C0|nr:hypothetical protein [Micromonospora sp. Llam0]ROO63177.1 hypothetical protein EDC02_5197 [Micromonospora sp. Llam0]